MVPVPLRILTAQGRSGESHWVWAVAACLPWLSPWGPLVSLPGACPDALAGQREAAARLLEVLEDLDRAHEEFQQQEQGKAALGLRGP